MLLPWLTCVRCSEGLLLYNMCFAICNFVLFCPEEEDEKKARERIM